MDTHAIPMEWYFFGSAALIILGILASKISSRVNTPVLLMFLAVGMLAGTDGIARLSFIDWGGISFTNYRIANFFGSVALCYILFSGGLGTNWQSIKRCTVTGGILASLGVLLTALVVALAGMAFFDLQFEYAMLLGAIISSTDAAAVFAVLRSRGVSLKGQLKPLLELESGSNDPMAAFMTIFMIGMIGNPGDSYWTVLTSFLTRMSLGIAFGLAIGYAAARIFDRVGLEYDGLYLVLGIGLVLFCYGICEIAGGNGFMAVYVCGLMMGNRKFLYKNGFIHFNDGISWLMQVTMFLMLGLLVNPRELPGIAVEGLVLSVVLMLVARPVAVYLCMLGSRYTWRERTFVSWVGLRGAAPIVLATFPAIYGVPNAHEYFTVVFFIVITSVLIQGSTLMPVAKLLKLDKPFVVRRRSPLQFEQTNTIAGEMIEYEIEAGTAAENCLIRDLHLPKETRIFLIRRGDGFVVPEGNTRILGGDGLMFLAEPRQFDAARRILSHRKEEEPS